MRRIVVAVLAVLALGLGSGAVLARSTGTQGDGPVLGPAVLVIAARTPTAGRTGPTPTVGAGTSVSAPPTSTGHASSGTAHSTSQSPGGAAGTQPSVVTAPPPSPSYVEDHGDHGDSGKGGSNSGGSSHGSGGG